MSQNFWLTLYLFCYYITVPWWFVTNGGLAPSGRRLAHEGAGFVSLPHRVYHHLLGLRTHVEGNEGGLRGRALQLHERPLEPRRLFYEHMVSWSTNQKHFFTFTLTKQFINIVEYLVCRWNVPWNSLKILQIRTLKNKILNTKRWIKSRNSCHYVLKYFFARILYNLVSPI